MLLHMYTYTLDGCVCIPADRALRVAPDRVAAPSLVRTSASAASSEKTWESHSLPPAVRARLLDPPNLDLASPPSISICRNKVLFQEMYNFVNAVSHMQA